MHQKPTFFQQLLNRRVPQLLGLYVAATWMTIEIGEWIAEKTGMDDRITFYIFVAMALFLPTIAVLAWNHGAPGKDRWRNVEKILIPVNGVIALGVVVLLMQTENPAETVANSTKPDAAISADPSNTGPTLTEKTLLDESGQEQTFQVPKDDFHRRIYAFFLQPDGSSEPDWIDYAVPWLLSVDLNRDLYFSASTPFDPSLGQRVVEAGYEKAVREPLSLQMQLAKERQVDIVLRGSHQKIDDLHQLAVDIMDVATGSILKSLSVQDANLITASGKLAQLISEELQGDRTVSNSNDIRLSLSETVTASEEALQHFVDGMITGYLNNDVAAAITLMDEAAAKDPEFAFAYAEQSTLYRLLGNIQAAAEANDKALRLEFKLPSEQRFFVKANRYAILGNVEKAIRVLEMTIEVHPQSYIAHMILVRNYLLVGQLDDAKTVLKKAEQIDPNATEILRLMARTEKLAGNYEASNTLLTDYLEAEPQDKDARLTLANNYLHQGEFEQAIQAFEDVSLLPGSEIDAEIGIAVTEARAGRLVEALDRVADIERQLLSDSQQVELGQQKVLMLSVQGRIRDALSALDEMDLVAQKVLPPVSYAMIMGASKASLHAEIGQMEQAMEILAALEAELTPPLDAFVAISKASIAVKQNDMDGVQENLDKMANFIDQFDNPAMRALANRYEAALLSQQGKHEEAIELFKESWISLRQSLLAEQPQMTDDLELALVKAYIASGQFDQAESALKAFRSRAPAIGEGAFIEAQLLLRKDETEAARDLLDELLDQWKLGDQDYGMLQKAAALRAELDQ